VLFLFVVLLKIEGGFMDLVGMQVEKNMRELKLTVLHRPSGTWDKIEVSRFVGGLMTNVYSHPQHPEHLILHGHYTKEQTLKALLGGITYTATQVVGINNEALPFRPSLI
jgi:hypothetical protein